VEHVDVVYWFQGMKRAETERVRVGTAPGGLFGDLLADVLDYVEESPWEAEVPPGSGYVRLQTKTEVDTPHGKQVYRCFTNPIWIQATDGGERRLRVTGGEW
jgi:hypothetical protein